MAAGVEDYNNFSDTINNLIRLLESREVEASNVSVSEVIKIYAAYLLRSENFSLSDVADFLAQAAALILSKVRAIFPRPVFECEEEEDATSDDQDEPNEKLHHFQLAAIYLEVLHYRRSKYFTRQLGETRPFYEVGDLYFLASLWWGLINNFNFKINSPEEDIISMSIEENQGYSIEARMEDIKNSLLEYKELTLYELLKGERDKSFVVSTIIALLELARIGIIYLKQRQHFGDIHVRLKECNG